MDRVHIWRRGEGNALGFQAGDGQRYLLQAPASRTTAVNAAGVVHFTMSRFVTTCVAIAQFHILTKPRRTETQ